MSGDIKPWTGENAPWTKLDHGIPLEKPVSEEPRTNYGPSEIDLIAWQKAMDAQQAQMGVKYDSGKLRWELLPHSLEEVVRVYTFGAQKYGDRNWEKGLSYSRMYGAAQRHINDWWFHRANTDPESGCHPLSAAVFYLLGLMHYEMYMMNNAVDDRPSL